MLFRTHIVFSLAVYFLLAYFLEMPFFVLGFVLFAMAFVDIDIKNSKFGNHWYFRPLQWMTKHRGVLHSLVACVFLSLAVGAISLWGGFGFFVGYVSHLFLDCLTRSGVKLFWPFNWKVRGFVKSGGIVEEVIFVLFLLGDIGLFVWGIIEIV
ncbi:metal-dependent hydrolase [Candidatus Pacearchaeota archaeon]|nr:metal-dependent hydrolase [Candidatus Pacearchaeota archaeon]